MRETYGRSCCDDDSVDKVDVVEGAEAETDAHHGEDEGQRLKSQLDELPDLVLGRPGRLKGLLGRVGGESHWSRCGIGIRLVSCRETHLRWRRRCDCWRWGGLRCDLLHLGGLLGGGRGHGGEVGRRSDFVLYVVFGY